MAGYADTNAPIPSSTAGFPANHVGVRDRLYLNQGTGRERAAPASARWESAPASRRRTSTTVSERSSRTSTRTAGSTSTSQTTSTPTGCTSTSLARGPAGLGFRFEERARHEGIDDPNAGMGIAAADYSRDGREDLFVTNSRRQLHAIYRSAAPKGGEVSFTDARPDFVAALGKSYTGWGVSWADLDLDGNLDLVLANGAIPVVNLKKDAQRIQVLQNLTGEGRSGEFADAGSARRPTRRSAQQRSRPGRSRLRQRRRPRRRDQLDRGPADPAPEHRGLRPLARGEAERLRSGLRGHRGTARRTEARARGSRRLQLPLLGGSPRPLRPRSCDQGQRADHALPGRHARRAAPASPPTRSSSSRPSPV